MRVFNCCQESRESILQNLISITDLHIIVVLLITITCGAQNVEGGPPDGTEMHAGDFVKRMRAEFPVLGNHWNLMRLTVENPHDREVDLHVAIYFDADTTLQYGRRIQVPPSTRIRIWMPVQLPDPRHIVSRSYPYHVLVRSLGDSSGLLPNESGSMQLDSALQIETNENATGIIHTIPPRQYLDTEPVINNDADALDFMLTGRFHQRLQRNWLALNRGFASSGELGLDGLKQLIIADNKLLSDPEGLDAIRRWLNSGGHLWVMLDKVDSRLLEVLLGDVYQGQEVESVELSSLQFVDSNGVSSARREYDTPVTMKRILVDDIEVEYSVDGWPAAFWIEYGRGKVLLTTLSSNAWVRPRTSDDPRSRAGDGWETNQVVLPHFEAISADYFSNSFDNSDRANSVLPVFASQINQFVGYKIPRRQAVVSILLGYSFLTFVVATYLWRKERLALFGLLGPLMAAATGVALIAVRPTDQNIPSMAVTAEIITPIPGTDDYQAQGIVGLCSTGSSVAHLTGHSGGWLLPDWAGYPSGIRSLNYSSETTWEWDGLRNTPGFRIGEFYQSGRFSRTDVVATFNEQGVSGQLNLPENLKPEDAIVLTRQGRIGAKISGEMQFTAIASDTLDSEQYLSANLLSDEQRRRSEIIAQLSTRSTIPWNINEPQLLFWTQPWDLGFEFGENNQRQGNALVAVPIQFQRPSAGSRVKIPGPFLDFREVIGPNGQIFGGLYSDLKHEWIEKSGHSETWLGFQIPGALLPLNPVRAQVQIDVSGPVGHLELSGWNGHSKANVKTWNNPVGRLMVTIEDTSSLYLTEKGQLLLFLSAGKKQEIDFSSNLAAPRWKIESMSLSLEADIPALPVKQN